MRALSEAQNAFTVGPALTRRGFVKAGGALVVSLAIPDWFPRDAAAAESRSDAAETGNSLEPTSVQSWLEFRADNTILAKTGRTETGAGTSGYYTQVIAEELNVRPEAISLIMGDTDRTPDGGPSSGFFLGANNLRKVAAYTCQAFLALASKEFGVPASQLTVVDGVVTGGGKRASYGELVQGKQLELTIPVSGRLPFLNPNHVTGLDGSLGFTVTGDPPVKPISQYKVVGTSFPMPGTPDKVIGKTVWVGDVVVPGMVHARMIRPATLGSTLVSVGSVDKQQFPTAEVVREGNLVAVLSPNEWEAVRAARSVAAKTHWTEWSGLPGSNNLTEALRAQTWGKPTGSKGDAGSVDAAFASAAKTISATYTQPFTRHAPIGPFVAVADVQKDGSATVWTHSMNSQKLRVQVANTLGTSVDKVVIRWLPASGQYGRATYTGDGAEGDAIILSQRVGKPVRVQWMMDEDLAWSTVSPAWIADVKAGLDANGKLVALRSDWYSPHENDTRMIAAFLAGRPTTSPKPDNPVDVAWPYNKVPALLQAYGMPSLGSGGSSAGLRGNIMRTPWQRQHTFAVESLVNECSVAAGVDAIAFRTALTTDARLLNIIEKTAAAAGWQTRPSPQPNATRTGATPAVGRGLGVFLRTFAYWAAIAEIEVTPSSGQVRVTKFTIGVDAGKVVNPRQLERIICGGVVQGLSEALKEEVTFDEGKVTSTDWRRFRILTMGETPEIQVVLVSRDDAGIAACGEAPNALAAQAVAAAFFDATGVQPRRIPLTPTYVQGLLKG